MNEQQVLVCSSALQTGADGTVSWRDWAACRDSDPAVFFPDNGNAVGIERAKQVCGSCAVTEECVSYAVGTNQTEGIWGGTTRGERRRLRRRRLKELREAG